jgi:DNA-directed RNA polymerase specialized sigma24 family protein
MMLRKKIAPLATISNVESAQDHRYRDAAAEFGAALERLARAYEFDPDRRRDLLQEIHLALWRSTTHVGVPRSAQRRRFARNP